MSTAGVDATGAISREIIARADRVNNRISLYNFDTAYQQMSACGTITNTGARSSCDIISAAEDLRTGPVRQQLARLSDIIRLRARALDQLAAAYRALGAEADYDARTDFETKIDAATKGVSSLGTALGLGPVPEIAAVGARLLGGQLAANAQRRRLIRDSARLRIVADHLRRALVAEQDLHAQVDQAIGFVDANTRRSLAMAGLVPPMPALKDVITVSGFPAVSDSTLQGVVDRSPNLAAAARVTALASRPAPSEATLVASVAVLDALIAKHQDFEAEQPLSLADLTANISRLTELVEAARASAAAGPTPAPTPAKQGGQ